MLFNGTSLVLQNSVDSAYTNHFLAATFLLSALVCWSFVLVQQKKLRLADLAIGAGAGVISYIVNFSLMRNLAIWKATPALAKSVSLVFPITFGASMMIVTLISAFVFREKLTPRGILAIIVGIASVVVLKLS